MLELPAAQMVLVRFRRESRNGDVHAHARSQGLVKLAIILAILVGGRRRREVDEGEDELKKRRLCMIYGRVAWELEKAPIAIGRSPRIFWHSTW